MSTEKQTPNSADLEDVAAGGDLPEDTPEKPAQTEAPEPANEEQDPAARIEELERQAAASQDQILRTTAEFENFKKRANREMEEFRKYANESLLKELLPVIDNLERAIESSDRQQPGVAPVLEGVELTRGEILKVLERFAVRPVEAVGQPFDPAFHQAMLQEEDDQHPENTVLSEYQRGYMIHDRLLRPAMVVVSKRPADGNGREESPQPAEKE